jgi:lipoyl(octanoyl) transferase
MRTSPGTHSKNELWVCHLGVTPYPKAVAMQERIREARAAELIPDTLLLLEHPPVYTRGRRSADGELPLGEDFYRARGIDVLTTNRGGRITYHGPGQLIGYPIMRIEAIDRYLRTMEQAIVAALAEEGIAARGRPQDGPDYTGVWVQERKIASIGVHVSRGVTTHGFALNVENDLEPFSLIVACGLPDVSMTSLVRELPPGRSAGIGCTRKRVAFQFCEAHARRQRLVSPRRLGIEETNDSRLAAERAPLKISGPLRETVPA